MTKEDLDRDDRWQSLIWSNADDVSHTRELSKYSIGELIALETLVDEAFIRKIETNRTLRMLKND